MSEHQRRVTDQKPSWIVRLFRRKPAKSGGQRAVNMAAGETCRMNDTADYCCPQTEPVKCCCKPRTSSDCSIRRPPQIIKRPPCQANGQRGGCDNAIVRYFRTWCPCLCCGYAKPDGKKTGCCAACRCKERPRHHRHQHHRRKKSEDELSAKKSKRPGKDPPKRDPSVESTKKSSSSSSGGRKSKEEEKPGGSKSAHAAAKDKRGSVGKETKEKNFKKNRVPAKPKVVRKIITCNYPNRTICVEYPEPICITPKPKIVNGIPFVRKPKKVANKKK